MALLTAVVIAAWAAADATWTFLRPGFVLPKVEVTAAGPGQGAPDYGKAISDAHLLGQPERRRQVERQVPVTRLDLKLLGVYDTADGDGFAFIREGNREQRLYRRGAALAGGGVLSEVRSDHVVLEVNGRMESLYFDKKKQPGLVGGVGAVADDAPVGARLAALRAQAISDPMALGKMIVAEPYRRGGRMKGYQIRQRTKTPLFNDVGLKDGDVLVEINGIRLNEPTKGLEVLQELASAPEITAIVERAGRSFTIHQQLN